MTHLSQGAASTASGDRLEMAYDADGHRTQLREVTAGTLTRTRDLRYQGDAIVEERVTDAAHPAGAVVRTYTVTDTGQVVSMTIAAGEPGADPTVPRTYLPTWSGHGDALALWRLEDDGTLSLANSFTYTTWGRPTTATHNGIGDLGFRLLYVGAQDVQWDDFSGAGLLYMHARHYSPLTGRFLQPDPSAAETNLYAYAGDSPVTKADPSGLDATGICRPAPGHWALVCDLGMSGYVLLAPLLVFAFGWLFLGSPPNAVVHITPRGARALNTMCAASFQGCTTRPGMMTSQMNGLWRDLQNAPKAPGAGGTNWRVDPPHVPGDVPHVHVNGGAIELGTGKVKAGHSLKVPLTNTQKEFLRKHGVPVP